MSDRFEGGCLCGAVRFVATGRTGISGVVPLSKLSETQRSTCIGLCGIQAHGLRRHQR